MTRTCTIDELRENFSGIAQQVRESAEPMFVEQGGQSSIALVDADRYLQDMQALSEFKRIFSNQ